MSKTPRPSSIVSGQTEADDLVYKLRRLTTVRELLKLAKSNPAFNVDFDDTAAELSQLSAVASKLMSKGDMSVSLGGAKTIARVRLKVQASRDRATQILNDMRTVHSVSKEFARAGSVWLRQRKSVRAYAQATQNEIIAETLSMITTASERSAVTIDIATTVIFNLDAKTRALDTWLSIWKEYRYTSGTQPGALAGGARPRRNA